ncbi:YajQ family cyclic di-GMP-binding protein [Ferrimonas pelagia]|uniref:Nucleotide-binding protein GCM10023333_08910 n=1 Tax=Ferrimonas pelagia TaxID=1177826 RepID=A0ABP9EFS8_9GAMM
MPSFDIVSEVDAVEVKNAVDNANRELDTRFDFRGVEASFSFSAKDMLVSIKADSEFRIQQMETMLRGALAKRNVEASSMDLSSKAEFVGKTVTQNAKFKQGIEQPLAKKIVKMIKEEKLKVQASIQGEKLRVTGKKRDDLQAAMAMLRGADLEQPVQFENFRD